MNEFIEKLIGRLEERCDVIITQNQENFPFSNVIKTFPIYEKDETTNITIRESIEIVNQLAEEYNGGWIPFKQSEMDEEELRCVGEEFGYILDCKLPDEDEEILVTYKNGTVGEDIFLRDGNECYLDSGNDFVTEAIAWMPKPAPYQPKGENNG